MSKTGCVYFIVDYTTFNFIFELLLFSIFVPGPVRYSCNKVAVAGTDFKDQYYLKR